MATAIFVTFQVERVHCWPDADDEVKYLRQLHRHLFHWHVKVSVKHDDREIEFIQFRSECIAVVNAVVPFKSTLSCEQMALAFLERMKGKYKGRAFEVTVSEDGENGAVVTA